MLCVGWRKWRRDCVSEKEPREFELAMRGAKKLRKLHLAHPQLHQWTPIRAANFSVKDYELQLGCPCGATVWVPAYAVQKELRV
jgi:hypothetical protein